MEGGPVSHSWCMCVVSVVLVIAMVGWVEAGVEVVDGRHAGQSQKVLVA